jgi:phosphinothricin acetyltransferase
MDGCYMRADPYPTPKSNEIGVAPVYGTDSMNQQQIVVKPAVEADLSAINAIYNHYIQTSPATFDIDPWTDERRAEWFAHYATTGRHRVLVATDGEAVVGFTYSSQHRPKQAYDTSIETTVYVAADHLSKGIGARLYGALFDAIAGEDIHRAYAGITQPNPASVALHERFGFSRAGFYTEQGRKFGRYWDVAWYEKKLG